jgi:RNA polymerase sigma-70 factor (ECF subfamily)
MLQNQYFLNGLTSGNEKIFRLIMEEWYSRLFNFANNYLNNEENTKEVLQDVFLKLWDNRQKLSTDTNLNAYLFTLTRNRCIDLIRREKLMLQFRTDKQEEYRRLSENFEALSDPILDNLFAMEIQAEINRTISELPEQCQKVFVLSRIKGMNNREISRTMVLSEKTIESHLTKALKTIRLALERKFPESINLFLVFGTLLKKLSRKETHRQ